MPKVVLNGQAFGPATIAGLDGITATIRRAKEVGGSAFTFTGELTFYGDAYEVIRDTIILATAPHLVKVPILIYSDACPDQPFIGYIEGGNVDWCEISDGKVECSAKATIVDGSALSEKLACVRNTIIWKRTLKFQSNEISRGEDTTRQARYLPFCIQSSQPFLFELTLLFFWVMRFVLRPILFVVGVVVTVLNKIIEAINTIPFAPNLPLIDFDGNDDTSIFDEFRETMDALEEKTTGCGAKHKTPFVSSYIQNVCDICGLTLQSSILSTGGTYYDLMRLDAARYSTLPEYQSDKIEATFLKNAPNLNGAQCLDQLKRNFNWDWWIEGDTLLIEPLGELTGFVWFSQGDGTVVKSFCIGTTDEDIPAYGVYDYQEDLSDVSGSQVRNDWVEVVDWNAPPNAVQRGAKQHLIEYSAALFRKDFNGDGIMPIDHALYSKPTWFPTLLKWQNVIVLARGTSSFPKMLMWDGVSAQDNARVVKWPVPGTDKFEYNTPMFVKRSHPSGQTLYNTSFEKTDDPRVAGIRIRNFSMEICLTCALLETAPKARQVAVIVNGENRIGLIEEIQINYSKMTAQIKGKL